MLKWRSKKTTAQQKAREIIEIAIFLHQTFKGEVWLWRGQARSDHDLVPGMHTRILNHMSTPHYRRDPQPPNDLLKTATEQLLNDARNVGLDRQGDIRLPDMALLANLQHYGAATPLLDVTTDPLIALWMIAFANSENPAEYDKSPGYLYGIIKPPEDRRISAYDARKFSASGEPSILNSLQGKVWWYEAPDVSERLRIQRGSFLIGPLSLQGNNLDSSLPLNLEDGGSDWLNKRVNKRGKQSNTAHRTTDAFAIVVPGAVKKFLRQMLVERSGLTIAAVYPIPWHRPIIEQFSRGYGRSRKLSFDLPPLPPRVIRRHPSTTVRKNPTRVVVRASGPAKRKKSSGQKGPKK